MTTCARQHTDRKSRPEDCIGGQSHANEISTGACDSWNTLPAPVPGTAWGTTSVLTWQFEPVSCLFSSAVSFYRILNLPAIPTRLGSLPAAARHKGRPPAPPRGPPPPPLPPTPGTP